MDLESEDTKLDEWRESTKAILGRFRAHSEPFKISNVPEELREGSKNACMPKAISIGPRHKGTRRNLMKWEKIKWHCMQSLLHRGPKGAATNLKQCTEVISGLEKEVRASYADDLKLEWNDLANIMLSDACFLLEILISGSKDLNEKLGRRSVPPSPVAEVGKKEEVVIDPMVLQNQKEEVVIDLMVLENQIPLFILHKLSERLFDEVEVVPVETLALNLFGYFPSESFKYFTPNIASHHFLELVHSYVSEDSEEKALEQTHEEGHQHVCIPINAIRSIDFQGVLHRCADCCAACNAPILEASEEFRGQLQEESGEQLQVTQESVSNAVGNVRYLTLQAERKRCAPILEAAGVTIKTTSTEKNHMNDQGQGVIKGFNFDIKFSKSNGTLEIPPLHITKSTEVMWRNLIAWEQGHTGFSCKHKCTWAAFFFNGLICGENDVQLLKDRHVIVDHLQMSNRKLLEFFRSIVKDADRGKISDSPYWEMVSALNSYYGTCGLKVKQFPIMLWHSWLPSAISQIDRIVLRGYNFLIAMIYVCVLLNTIYTILSFKFRRPQNSK